MSILNETQFDRDRELAKIIDISVEEAQALPIATPNAIRVSDGVKPENLEDLYHDYEHLNFPAYLKTLMKTSATRRHPELFKFLNETKDKVCLDFGSGVGTHAIALMENNCFVIMLDVPGKLQDFTAKRVNNRIGSIKRGGIIISNECELYNDYYDIVICTDVLEHVEEPIIELSRIRRSMKIGGTLHLQVSTMIKPSSGHFPESINKWKLAGPSYLKKYFEKVGATLYKRIK